ncbi:hypothetical protein HOB95_01200, partial [bacterium]|nr:hypothetical protein [bacterium]
LSAEQYEDIRLLSDLCTELEFSQSGMPVKGLPIKLLMRLIEKIARSSVHDFGKLLYSDQSFNIMRSLLHRIVVAIHNKVVPEQQNMSQEDRALMLVRGAMKAIVDLRDDKIDQMEFAQKTFVLGLCLLKLVVDIEEEAGYKVA